MISTELLLIAFASFLVAGIVKGTIGVGLPTITISIMAQLVDPRIAIALLLLPALVTNCWQIYRGGQLRRSVELLWPFALTMMVCMFVSVHFAAVASVQMLVAGIGCMVVLWTGSSLLRQPPHMPARLDRPLQLVAGAVSGVIGGLTAIWSPPMIMYLQARHRDKDDFVAFTGFLILCGTLPLTLGYIRTGLLSSELALGSALMILPTFAGFSIGEYLRARMNSAQFHKVVLIVFCLMGLNLIRKALTGSV